MIVTTEIRVSELLALVEKGRDITLNDKSRLDNELRVLSETHNLRSQTGRLTREQSDFVRRVLPAYVLHRVPLLAEVMAVYGLTPDTVFYHKTEPCICRY